MTVVKYNHVYADHVYLDDFDDGDNFTYISNKVFLIVDVNDGA